MPTPKAKRSDLSHRRIPRAGERGDGVERLAPKDAPLQEAQTALAQRTRDLTEALEQRRATNEILRVISGLSTDVRPCST